MLYEVITESAPSALFSLEQLVNWGHNVIAISGAITSSPLSSKEFTQNSEAKLVSSIDSGTDLSDHVLKFIRK